MLKKRFNAEQIVVLPRQIEVLMSQGKSAPMTCREEAPAGLDMTTFRTRYREGMIQQAGIAIFIGGFRVDTSSGSLVVADGVIEEFETAQASDVQSFRWGQPVGQPRKYGSGWTRRTRFLLGGPNLTS